MSNIRNEINAKIERIVEDLMDNHQLAHLHSLYEKEDIIKFCRNYNRYENHDSFIEGIMRKCKSKVRAGFEEFTDGKFVTVQYDWHEEDYEWLLRELEGLAGFIAN
jgi:hypothetical protein